MLIALMIFVTFTSATLQVTAVEDGQIRFVKGQVKPIDNRTVIRGKHIHSIEIKASEKLAALGKMLEDCPQNNIVNVNRL